MRHTYKEHCICESILEAMGPSQSGEGGLKPKKSFMYKDAHPRGGVRTVY